MGRRTQVPRTQLLVVHSYRLNGTGFERASLLRGSPSLNRNVGLSTELFSLSSIIRQCHGRDANWSLVLNRYRPKLGSVYDGIQIFRRRPGRPGCLFLFLGSSSLLLWVVPYSRRNDATLAPALDSAGDESFGRSNSSIGIVVDDLAHFTDPPHHGCHRVILYCVTGSFCWRDFGQANSGFNVAPLLNYRKASWSCGL